MADAALPPNRIRELREALNLSQEQLAKRVSPPTSQPQIDRLEKGQRGLDIVWMGRVATALGVEPQMLLIEAKSWSAGNKTEGVPAVDIHRNANTEELVATKNDRALELLQGRPTLVRDLPIRGHTKAGQAGFFIDQGETWGLAMRPESLRSVTEAYAVRVHDDCMVPRFDPGNILQIDPFRTPKPGDNVIIQLNDGQAFVKVLVRRAAGAVTCSQFNPKKEIVFKKEKVRSVHLVVGVDYLER